MNIKNDKTFRNVIYDASQYGGHIACSAVQMGWPIITAFNRVGTKVGCHRSKFFLQHGCNPEVAREIDALDKKEPRVLYRFRHRGHAAHLIRDSRCVHTQATQDQRGTPTMRQK